MKRVVKVLVIILIVLALILFSIRLLSPKEIDDVSPGMPCEEEYLGKSDVFWVIPFFEGKPISENQEWCGEILKLNKTLGLHGFEHTYWEFKRENISQEHLSKSIEEFESCFGFSPEKFKPPNLRLSKENKKLIEDNGLVIKYRLNQLTHKVYHCNDSGTLPNWFHDVF